MIELKNVTKRVRSGREYLTILDDITLEIPTGEFIAVTGASGSGKTTLLSLIAGLDLPSEGEIKIDGQEITLMNEDELAELRAKKIGIIFQAFHLIPSLTALENVLIPMEINGFENARERAMSLLEDVGLINRAHHFPSELSGGEQQRVCIARAFANRPKILLADEPTGNLDSRNGRQVFELMMRLHKENQTTLILVTHDQELASYASRQIKLKDGRIIEDIKRTEVLVG
ncbi:MAG: ABC transporter ATP-binding protein [Acidobacteriota bacterium]|nr:ABC transporter ATP-binding protein [Pyrinomonadaceae bacterium]MDW8303886.1 ABC transporter ATP-binding protein [Acidobacteriota bacterium]